MEPNLIQPETSAQNLKSGSEVAQKSGSVGRVKGPARKVESGRNAARTHVDYWKPRLVRRSYKHEGEDREINDYYVRIQHGGRREFFPLHTSNRDAGAIKARDIYLSVKGAGWDQAISKFKPDAAGKPKLDITVGDYLSAVEGTRRLRGRTFLNYRNCLRTIIAEAFGITLKEGENKYDYRGGGNTAWIQRIDDIRLVRLTPEVLNRWKRNRIAAADPAPAPLASARRTINSYIRCSRSLFAPALVRELKGLELPAPLPFHGLELEESGSQKYVSKIDVQALIAAARAELKSTDPESYKVFLLGLFAGMRKAEIDSAEWHMLDFTNNVIHLHETEWLHLKTADSAADITVDEEVFAELRALKPSSDSPPTKWSQFILVSTRPPQPNSARAYYRCEDTFDRLNTWLRDQKIDANKPLHELRKEVGAILATSQGIYAASHFLRHSDITTTARHYADQKSRINVGLGKFLVPPPKAAEKPAPKRKSRSKVDIQ